MIHNRKGVFTVQLDGSKGESPELLMAAIAMAIFDLAPALHDDDAGVDHARYDRRHALTSEEAKAFVINGREVSMMFPKGRMCVAHVFATRLTPDECEIVLTMYDQDGDKLLARAGTFMDTLVAEQAADTDVGVELDNGILIFEDEDEVTLRDGLLRSA